MVKSVMKKFLGLTRKENDMNKHNKKEIEKLKSFKKWYLWFLSASEEEKKEYLKNRWKTKEEK